MRKENFRVRSYMMIFQQQKQNFWDKCRIMSEILFDYVVETEKRLKAVREAWEILWNQEVKKDSEMIPARSGGRNSE